MMALSGRCDGYFVFVMLMMAGLIGVCVNGENDGDSVGAPMVKTEQEALYSAIQGFVGKWWNGSDLYPDPCGWTPIQGVSCDIYDGFWYVTELSIGQIHDNSLPCAQNLKFRPQFFKLQHLKSLSVFNCIISPSRGPISIQSANWDAFSSTIESIEFRANPGLTGQIPTSFGNLKKLQSLVLIDNGLSGGLPVSIGSLPLTFGGLTSLLKFDLSKNLIGGEIPSEISNLKNLTLLDLSNNKISGGLTFASQEMSSLEELILSSNPISGNLVNFKWQNVYRLMVLDLSNMGLTGEIPELISSLKNLRFLGLSDNKLSGNLSPKLAELRNLTALYVNGNNLTGELKFPREFYMKMGRRFGVRNNSNLCFPVDKLSTSVRPFGVKVCRE
ncbi:putative leucine-rich repeat domain superfamily [Helianthus annuus]|nr:putative leucine-rich repeat domain superfamily [Helianthus annuus]KAJ0634214.1 putative leucine-rich repeat domain superfamily [Helianthus annuus]KAJ0638025.1 putative leucine-rich repeat domain superfamily [Helianthus annuus]